MTISDERLAEMRERCEAATPGPWEALVPTDPGDRSLIMSHAGNKCVVAACDPSYVSEDQAVRNAISIAHARVDLPAALAEIERLKEFVAEVADDTLDRASPGLRKKAAELLGEGVRG